MEILLIENGLQVPNHFPSLATSMAGIVMSSIVTKNGMANSISPSLLLTANHVSNTTLGIRYKSKVKMEKRKIKIQLGQPIACKIKTHSYTIVVSGTQQKNSNGRTKDQLIVSLQTKV